MQHFVPLMADFGQDAGSASLLREARRIKATTMRVQQGQIQMKLEEICRLVGSGISNLPLQSLRGWNGNKPNAKVTGLSEVTNHTIHFASQTWDSKTLREPPAYTVFKQDVSKSITRSGAASGQTCDISSAIRRVVHYLIESHCRSGLV